MGNIQNQNESAVGRSTLLPEAHDEIEVTRGV